MICDSPLNEAHYLLRAAENHLRNKRFDESIECHNKAKVKIIEALELVTDSPGVVLSLKLQQDYHNRQERIIKMKKEHEMKVVQEKKAMEEKKAHEEKEAQEKAKDEATSNNNPNFEDLKPLFTLKEAINKNFEEADSLFGMLLPKNHNTGMGMSTDSQFPTSESQTPIEGSKLPKAKDTVIEELKTVNQTLRNLVVKLVEQVGQITQENEMYKERIRNLESQLREAKMPNEQRGINYRQKNSIQVMTDSNEENYSPFVCSPSGELSPDVACSDHDQHDIRSLPILPPLEMPNFDFSLLEKQNYENSI